jgi:hypothetical protein
MHESLSNPKMMLSEIKHICSDIQAQADPRPRFTVVIDELLEAGMPSLNDLLNRGRAAGVSIIVSDQDLADGASDDSGQKYQNTLLDNTATKLFFGAANKSSAEKRSYYCGGIAGPESFMHCGESHKDGLHVGEMLAYIDGEIYRVKGHYES